MEMPDKRELLRAVKTKAVIEFNLATEGQKPSIQDHVQPQLFSEEQVHVASFLCEK